MPYLYGQKLRINSLLLFHFKIVIFWLDGIRNDQCKSGILVSAEKGCLFAQIMHNRQGAVVDYDGISC